MRCLGDDAGGLARVPAPPLWNDDLVTDLGLVAAAVSQEDAAAADEGFIAIPQSVPGQSILAVEPLSSLEPSESFCSIADRPVPDRMPGAREEAVYDPRSPGSRRRKLSRLVHKVSGIAMPGC